MNKPYTYLIGWTQQDRWYYGCRFSKTACSSDLWVKYFTSSRYVAKMRIDFGEPDVVEVRREFDTPAATRAWEERVLRRLKAIKSDRWLNRCYGGVFFHTSPEGYMVIAEKLRGVPRSAETKEKLRIARTGKKNPHTKEWSVKVSAAKMGHVVTAETREKLRAANIGKKQTPEALAKMIAKTTGTKRSDETKEKMRQARERRKAAATPLTQENRAKLASNLAGWKERYTTEQLAEMYAARSAKVRATWAAKAGVTQEAEKLS